MIKLDTVLVFGIVCLLVAGCVVLFYDSLVDEEDSSAIWSQGYEPTETTLVKDVKIDYQRDEWNDNFADYRAGILSKSDMINYIGGCKW